MNQSAERHLAKAKEYLAKGDAWYAKAADEIIAAKAADDSLSDREIAKRFGHSRQWVGKIVAWRTSGTGPTPFAGREQSGVRTVRAAREVLREAPMEQVEQIISELPASRQRQIGAAAGDSYLRKVNEVADNTRRPVTEGISGMFGAPSIVWEERALLKKLAEVKEYLDAHGDEMIPDPDGGEAESIRDLSLGAYAASRGRINNAFAELGIGTSIEEGFNSLLSES